MVTTRSGRKTDGRPTDNFTPIRRALRDQLSEEECLVALHATPTDKWRAVYFSLSSLEYHSVTDAIKKEFPPPPLLENWCGTCN